ncbi:uncharacterized protein N7496_010288 [Penicillium cataractarum]|uniref:Uncharacterized protein n=1 Tax=Penicillium cataractarum TaxID=2100454 RepID=A0A9W9RRZ1_9EURO|nr:uncharacterized protein N7496_010288 [Penicillium cataractarum]KAJ5364575.1 hypothetical protein N7496_010288 [Penicillium cataractarum]
MYHTPGDIIVSPRIRAAESITRESAAASSWSESDLLCWEPGDRETAKEAEYVGKGGGLARAVRRMSYKAPQESGCAFQRSRWN